MVSQLLGIALSVSQGGDVSVLAYDQTVALDHTSAGALASGPVVTQPGTIVADLVAVVCDRSNPATTVATLDQAWNQRWQETLNEPGAGSLTLANGDPDLAAIGDSLIRFDLHGRAAFTFLASETNRTSIAAGEEADQVTEIAGPGHLAILEEALVYPARGVASWPIEEDRIFAWPAYDYNDTGWANARIMAPWGATTNTRWITETGDPIPEADKWPAPDAAWIWGAPGTWDWARDGYCYFRSHFTVPTGVHRIGVSFAADWIGELYIDGQHIGTNEYDEQSPTPVFTDTIDVTPGDHVVAISCVNDTDPESDFTHNPGGILFAAFALDPAGHPILPPIVQTDATWKVVSYPENPPGMTVGEILLRCLGEAQTRGALLEVEARFTELVDSAGVPWENTFDVATKVGTDLLTFTRELTATYCDVWMEPGGFGLCAWALDGRGTTRPVDLHPPTDPADPTSGNLTALVHRMKR